MLVVIAVALMAANYHGLIGPTGPASITTASFLTSKSSRSEVTANWPTYHKELSRNGFEPNITSFGAVGLNWRSIGLDGDVYAEPLVDGKTVIIATENDSLYDLDADTGRVVWRTNLGSPVRGSNLPCGNIDPSGITGTPTIDISRGIVYVVAFLTPAHHELFAVDLAGGTVRFHVLVDPSGADPKVEQQRAALALSGGYVYIAYGGLFGDCGSYHGWVVAYRTDGDGTLLSYQVPTGRAGGIWAPSGPALNSVGELFVATGNSFSYSVFDLGNSVIKLSPDLNQLDWFAPTNWIQLNEGDTDLGSTGPIILNSQFIFQIGKEGVGYLLDAKKLGGIGGQLFSAQVCSGLYGGAYGGLAYSPPYLLIPCRNGIVALETSLESKPSFALVWRGPSFVPGSPVVAGSAVWTVDVGNGLIYALRLGDGQVLFQDKIGSVTHFTSLSVGDGQVVVSASRHVIGYRLEDNGQRYSSYPPTNFYLTISTNLLSEGNNRVSTGLLPILMVAHRLMCQRLLSVDSKCLN